MAARLIALSRREGVTSFMLMLAAFKVLLHKYTGGDDIVVGTGVANRNRSETENIVGFFVNQLVLRTNLGGDPTFCELLKRVRHVALEAYAYQDAPFEKVVESLRPERSLSHTPLFQVTVEMDNTPTEPLKLPGVGVEVFNAVGHKSQFDLTLTIAESPEGILCTFNYNMDLFDASVIKMSRHFEMLLNHIVTTPTAPIKELIEKLDKTDKEHWSLKENELKEVGLLTFKTGKRRAITHSD
jgi:non-ribosomal peptide synthetase component F